MSREIRFRAWDGETMIYESLQKEYDDYYMLNLQGEFFGHTRTGDHDFVADKDPENNKPWVLMQFIGRLDKNGQEIYEGDIISKHGAYVMWDENLMCFCFQFKNSKTPPVPLYYDNSPTIEVIGNIYNNPELLLTNTK